MRPWHAVKKSFTWSTKDSALVEGLLIAATVVVLLVTAGSVVSLFRGDCFPSTTSFTGCSSALALPVDLDDSTDLLRTIPEASTARVALSPPGNLTAVISSPNATDRTLAAIGPVLGGAVIVGILLLLLAVARTLRRSEVFLAVNARRLTAVAVLIAAGSTAVQMIEGLCRLAILARYDVPDAVSPSLTVSFLPIGVGLLVAFVAEVFRRGVQLRTELDEIV